MVMALWKIGLQIAKRLLESGGGLAQQQQHTKKNQLYFANGGTRKKKRLRQVFAGNNTSQIWKIIRLEEKHTERNGFILIAQWQNLPFWNTNSSFLAVGGQGEERRKAWLQF